MVRLKYSVFRRIMFVSIMLAASPAFCAEEIPLGAEEGPVFDEFPSQFYEVASFPSLASPSLPNMIGPVLTPQIVQPLSQRLFPAVTHQPLLRSLLPYPLVLHRVVAAAPAISIFAQSLSLSHETGPGGMMKAYAQGREMFDRQSLGWADSNDVERVLDRLTSGRLYSNDELRPLFREEIPEGDWNSLYRSGRLVYLRGGGKSLYVGLGAVDRGAADGSIRQAARLISFPYNRRKIADGIVQLVQISPVARWEFPKFGVLYRNALVQFAQEVAFGDYMDHRSRGQIEIHRPHPLFADNLYYDGSQGWSKGIAPEDRRALEGIIDYYSRSDELCQEQFGSNGRQALGALREFLAEIPDAPSAPAARSKRKRRRSSRAVAKNLDPNNIEKFLSRLNAGQLYEHYSGLEAAFRAEALGGDFNEFWGQLEKEWPEFFVPVGGFGKKLYVGLGTVDRGPWDSQIRQAVRLISLQNNGQKMAEGVARLVAIYPEAGRDFPGFDVLYWNALVAFSRQVASGDQFDPAFHNQIDLQRPRPWFTDNLYYEASQGWSKGISPEDKQALKGLLDYYLSEHALCQERFGIHGPAALLALESFLAEVPDGPSAPAAQPALRRPPATGSREILRRAAPPAPRRPTPPHSAAGDPVKIREGIYLFSLPKLPGFEAVHSLKSEARRLIRRGGLAALTEAIGILTHAHGMMHALSEFGLDQNAERAQETLHGEILLLLQNVHWALARAQLRSHVDSALDAPRQETMGYERLEDSRGALDGLYASESAEGMHLSRSFDARMKRALETLLVQLMYESMMDRLGVSPKLDSEEYQAGRGAHIVFLVEILETLALGGFDLAENGSIFLDHAGERRDHARGAYRHEQRHNAFDPVKDRVHPLLESRLGGYSSQGPNGHLFN